VTAPSREGSLNPRTASSRHEATGVHRCGDTPSPGGVGKTSGAENFTSLLNDVSSRLFDALPDDTWFYPGHGDDSTLGEQNPHLDEWRAHGW
jgi:glyoxylase-like metal-dependent hydrolase (beta-lactamase superfamily II)